MKTVFFLALRNFIRQKRRNTLLGLAIAFGVMVLTVAFAFTEGLTDTILNRIVIYMSGHVQVNMIEQGRMVSPIIRDRDSMITTAKNTVDDIVKIEEAIGTYCRAVGNGKGDYVYMVGLKLDQTFKDNFHLVSGSFTSFSDGSISNPVLISEEKAKVLNVKLGDRINVRLLTVNGQNNTGAMTVAGILKSQNVWMDYAMFTPKDDLKGLLGYQVYETGALQLMLKDPHKASIEADKLWQKLQPKPAYIPAHTTQHVAVIVSALNEDKAKDVKKGCRISSDLAKTLALKIGDTLEVQYPTKFGHGTVSLKTEILDIAPYPSTMPTELVWMENDEFFKQYNHFAPQKDKTTLQPQALEFMATEWKILPRTKNTDDYTKKMKQIMKDPKAQPMLIVASMYEMASMIVSMEQALNLAALVGSSIILFIIMVGVLNALRMTIRERTMEIGTMRAIGMTRAQVRNLFMIESLLLALAGWVFGTLAALLVMKLLWFIQFGVDNPLNMMMVDRRIFFIPTVKQAVLNLILLMVFMAITAYFPARRAAKLSPAVAFGNRG